MLVGRKPVGRAEKDNRPEVLKPIPSASVNPQPVSRAAPPVPALRLSARRASSAVTPAASSRGRVCR
jgi:hypothetical protein